MAKDIIIIILILSAIGLVYLLFYYSPPLKTVTVNINNSTYTLEVAKTLSQKAKGLMDRASLAKDKGMIFVSNFDTPQSFWMKNTLIPLDLIFIKSDGRIINIVTANSEKDTSDSELTIYSSLSPAKYVIELNAGEASRLGLKSGNIIDLSNVK